MPLVGCLGPSDYALARGPINGQDCATLPQRHTEPVSPVTSLDLLRIPELVARVQDLEVSMLVGGVGMLPTQVHELLLVEGALVPAYTRGPPPQPRTYLGTYPRPIRTPLWATPSTFPGGTFGSITFPVLTVVMIVNITRAVTYSVKPA